MEQLHVVVNSSNIIAANVSSPTTAETAVTILVHCCSAPGRKNVVTRLAVRHFGVNVVSKRNEYTVIRHALTVRGIKKYITFIHLY